jgi:hypothetical protein
MAICFDNLISIKSLCTTSSGSSPFYIEDIGITAEEAGFYINSEYKNGAELITDKIRFATDIVRKTISNHFAAHINSKSLIDSQRLGDPQDSLSLKSGLATTLGGISLTLNNYQSYFNVFVNEISLQVNVTQNVSVLVYDLISGALLDTLVVPCVANVISSKTVNKTYSSPKRKLDLIFVYDTEGISSNTTTINTYGCTTCSGYTYTNWYINSAPIYLDETATKIRSSLTNGTHTFGLSVNYSVQCSIENWLCEIANLIAMPILYKVGEEIMNYACFYSNRQTSSVNIDAERNKERLAAYQKAYNDALMATIQKINLPKNDPCFLCETWVKNVVILP